MPAALKTSVLLAALALALTGCSQSGDAEDAPGESAAHTHAPGETMVSMLVGDGTSRSEVGYRLTHVHLPRTANRFGEVRFTIMGHDDLPILDYVPVQTKDLHLYVVSEDLTVFRHLHPTMDSDGVWVAPLTLPTGGKYRVVTEFAALDPEGNGDLVMLGAQAPKVGGGDSADQVSGDQADDDAAEAAHSVEVVVEGDLTAGREGSMTLAVRDEAGRPVALGDYLGAGAHVTGFHVDTGAVAHLHPLGQPEVAEDATRLRFHTEFEQEGTYRAFVQVRVAGLLETVPITLRVG